MASQVSTPSDDRAHSADEVARDLCIRTRAGDEAAFASLYHAWFDRLMAFAMSVTRRDEAFAADVVQETFLRVIRGLPALVTAAALEAWIFTTARRVAVDILRSELARTRREGASVRHRDVAPAEASIASTEELVAELVAAIDGLERAERDALLVRVGEGLTLAESAGALGISEGAVHGRVRRAVAKLRRVMGGGRDA